MVNGTVDLHESVAAEKTKSKIYKLGTYYALYFQLTYQVPSMWNSEQFLKQLVNKSNIYKWKDYHNRKDEQLFIRSITYLPQLNWLQMPIMSDLLVHLYKVNIVSKRKLWKQKFSLHLLKHSQHNNNELPYWLLLIIIIIF